MRKDIWAAHGVLENVAHYTPVMTSERCNDQCNARVFFKCENLQRTGSFKFRGAYNALSKLTDEQRRAGVLAYSSGNHAQAVALASQLWDTRCVIVMPDDAPAVKLKATRSYYAEVIQYDKHSTTREELAAKIAEERGLTIIPPYDHPHVIAGQGTTALEFHQQVMGLDILLVPVGGGGLISGCAAATSIVARRCRVIGVEPETADDATRSFRTGELQTVSNPETIADGARTRSLGKHTFPLIREHVSDMITVTDEQIIEAMHFLWSRLKLVVEPTGALAYAALHSRALKVRDIKVGVILSGGNVDVALAG
jgi:threo-3-hydroxy-L-aspartate ammonia-lyase